MNFFWKKTKLTEKETVQSVNADINQHFIGERLAEINERLRKIENRQKETGIQLEEIDGFLQGGGNEPVLVDALVMLIDIIEDFYCFASAEADSPLAEQSMMMWNTALSAAETAGIEIITAAFEPFDFNRHTAESTEQDGRAPNGYVIKTLKCGYIYKGEIVRRATVVVNKSVNADDGQKILQDVSFSQGSAD